MFNTPNHSFELEKIKLDLQKIAQTAKQSPTPANLNHLAIASRPVVDRHLLNYNHNISKEDSEDICQNVLISTIRKETLHRWDSENHSFYSYLGASVRNAIVDHLREKKLTVPILSEILDSSQQSKLKNVEDRLFIGELVKGITPLQSKVLKLKMSGRTFAEISKLLNKNEINLRGIYSRMIIKLRKKALDKR